MTSGILLITHGKPAYWDEAVTLAKSLRLRSPSVPLAIASDLSVSEAIWRSAGFDAYVPWDFRACGGVSFKMHLDRIKPFRDATLFIDSDTICYRDISSVFEEFSSREFVALGKTLPACHWFEATAIRREFSCDTFPFFCGDFYLFRPSATASRIFDTARDIAGRHKSVGIKSISAWCNDEPAFSLAMAIAGVSGSEGNGEWIVQVARSGVTGVDLNYANGKARVEFHGTPVTPRIGRIPGRKRPNQRAPGGFRLAAHRVEGQQHRLARSRRGPEAGHGAWKVCPSTQPTPPTPPKRPARATNFPEEPSSVGATIGARIPSSPLVWFD